MFSESHLKVFNRFHSAEELWIVHVLIKQKS